MTPTEAGGAGVDGARLWDSVEALARVGATADGGVDRVALTEDDRRGRELVEGWLAEVGCELRRDGIGNVFAHLPGATEGPALMLGSHLDSQPNGGRFDGALGVLCGVEVLRALAARGEAPALPVELAIWTDEEGARFDVSCIGSSVYAGEIPLAEALALRDADGVTVGAALDALGLRGEAAIGEPLPAAYLELHIEQGPVLERLGMPIGIVEAIPGTRWHEIRFTGASGHAGATPYELRHDTLLPAAEVIRRLDQIGRSRPPYGRGTTCKVDVSPNAGSVLPGEVTILTDLRHTDEETVAAMEAELRDAAAEAARAAGVEVEVRSVWGQRAVPFDPAWMELLERASAECGLDSHRLPSGAGHDAGLLAALAPTGMLFVPCADGVSHHPAERVEPDDAVAGARVLLRAVELWLERQAGR